MTNRVIIYIVSITMNGISTITQKGQVAIPKSIRDQFNLKPFDRIRFTVEDGKIIAQPTFSINDMFGIIPVKKALSKKQYKEAIKKHVLKKYVNRS